MASTDTAVSASAVQAAHEVRTAIGRLRRRLKETYDTEGLTPSQTSALSRLSKGGPASTSELAAAERVRHQSMAATIAVLDERGLVERRPDPADGRRQLLSVSRTGRAFLEDRRRASVEWLARSLQERYTEAERQAMLEALALLDRLVES
jgi:DNA-binding MarR family transcriptional regulator